MVAMSSLDIKPSSSKSYISKMNWILSSKLSQNTFKNPFKNSYLLIYPSLSVSITWKNLYPSIPGS